MGRILQAVRGRRLADPAHEGTGSDPEEGFVHGLGHGLGLDVHERPNLARLGDELVAGDVIAIEPALYRPGFGGCRLEDVVLVTEDGCERIGSFPYDLRAA